MDLPRYRYLPGEIAARTPEPETKYYSNPDWCLDDRGPLLLWDTFGGDFALHLARREETGWHEFATFPGAMHSHLIDLPEQGLTLVLGVRQTTRPRSIDLWWSHRDDDWHGPVELFGAADYHAGSTPWAIHDGRLFVPFEIQATKHWGSYTFGAVHADLKRDLTQPASWTLTQGRIPWTALPGCLPCGGLEGNLVSAPDGELYNLLRIPAYNRLGRARWNGCGWDWLGLVQGVHNQSKHDIFSDPSGERWFLLANGWPARGTSSIPHAFRNTLCLWSATEPDLSRWRFLRVVMSDLVPRHAFSYVAGIVTPDDTLLIAERHGDDETHNFHDTNCTVVRTAEGFSAWVAEPGLTPYGHAETGDDDLWTKSNSQDGLLLSHLDGALYPMELTATVRVDALPAEVGALDLLGFTTCDLVSIAAVQLVEEGHGAVLALSAGGRRLVLRETVLVGEPTELKLTMLDPVTVQVAINGEVLVTSPTHVASDPSLAGVPPRADRPTADLGRVTVLVGPGLSCGETACPAPELREAWVVIDGRGMTTGLPDRVASPFENVAGVYPLVGGGTPGAYDPWAGGIYAGEGAAAVWSELGALPDELTLGGFGQLATNGPWTVILTALGELDDAFALRRDRPYLCLLLRRDDAAGPARLALAWNTGDERLFHDVAEVPERFGWALTLQRDGESLLVTVYYGEPGAAPSSDAAPVAATVLPAAACWLALAGTKGREVRSMGGLYVARAAWTVDEFAAVVTAGYATKQDVWPAHRPTVAGS